MQKRPVLFIQIGILNSFLYRDSATKNERNHKSKLHPPIVIPPTGRCMQRALKKFLSVTNYKLRG